MLWSVVVGLAGGLVAAVYYYLLEGGLHLIWDVLAGQLSRALPAVLAPWFSIWPITTVGGLLVGLALYRLGTPGEISAVVDNIHMRHGRLDSKQTPSMTVVSLLSISFGGSAGPEAPLVQIIGSMGSRLGERLALRGDLVRTFTFCGMGAALGAFFGAPLGGALFALEIPHNRGLQYFEALLPTVLASVSSFLVFRGLVGYEGPLYVFDAVPDFTLETVLMGLGLGLLGATVATVFVWMFRRTEHVARRLHHRPILLATLGGLSIGLIALAFPQDLQLTTLFWGEFELIDIINSEEALLTQYGRGLAVLLLLLLAVGKMLAISCTLHAGFRGGFIFPLFFIGAAAGLALSMATNHAVPPAVSMLCLMAAINVAVTKTPISTSVILTTISGTAMLPVIATASLVSFLATTRVSLIRTQRARHPLHPGIRKVDDLLDSFKPEHHQPPAKPSSVRQTPAE